MNKVMTPLESGIFLIQEEESIKGAGTKR
jgi:hypothetical protein